MLISKIVITMFCLYKGHQSSCCQVKIKSLLLVVLHIYRDSRQVCSAVFADFFEMLNVDICKFSLSIFSRLLWALDILNTNFIYLL